MTTLPVPADPCGGGGGVYLLPGAPGHAEGREGTRSGEDCGQDQQRRGLIRVTSEMILYDRLC